MPAPVRILLVEDNPGDALIFREKLSSSDLDAELVHVVRLSQAIESLQQSRFDILLVDLSLPDAHGIDSVVQVRRAAPSVPVIVLTGLDDATVAAEAKKSGAVDYLVKWYVDSVSLARYIRYAIEQYRLYSTEVAPTVTTTAPVAPAAAPPAAPPTAVAAVAPPVPAKSSPEALFEPSPPVAPPAPPTQPATAPQPPPAVAAPLPASEPEPSPSPADALALDAAALGRTPGGDGASASVGVSTGDHVGDLRAACEVAVQFAEAMAQQSVRTAHILRAALDLVRQDERGDEARAEPLDVLDLAKQAAARHRDLALRRGVPLRVASGTKKVMAVADRNLLARFLDRLMQDALWTARSEELTLDVASDDGTATAVLAWAVEPGREPGAAGEDACDALGLALAGRLAERAGGAFACHGVGDGRVEATLSLPATGGA